MNLVAGHQVFVSMLKHKYFILKKIAHILSYALQDKWKLHPNMNSISVLTVQIICLLL